MEERVLQFHLQTPCGCSSVRKAAVPNFSEVHSDARKALLNYSDGHALTNFRRHLSRGSVEFLGVKKDVVWSEPVIAQCEFSRRTPFRAAHCLRSVCGNFQIQTKMGLLCALQCCVEVFGKARLNVLAQTSRGCRAP